MTAHRSLRIRGLVRLQNRARESLARGLPSAELEAFRRDVRRALAFVDDACRGRGQRPTDLPPASRAAWRYLRDIDLDRLPVVDGAAAAAPPQLRIPSLVAAVDALTERVSHLSSGRPVSFDAGAVRAEAELIARRVRRLCADAGGSPGQSLPAPSRQAFATAAFLADVERLSEALATARTLHEIDREMGDAAVRASSPSPRLPLTVHLQAMGALYRARRESNAVRLRLNLGFLGAPAELLARAVRGARGQGRRARDREDWERWSCGPEFAAVIEELDGLAGGGRHRPAGRAWDLDVLFDELNASYFGGRLERPTLAWSRAAGRRRLGRYVASLDLVELTAALDDPAVPREVVAWVLYHELLHKQLPGEWRGGRLVVHPPEFRALERRFPDWERWDRWLRRFASR